MATEDEVVFDTRYDEEDDLRSESGSMAQRNEQVGSEDDARLEDKGDNGEQKNHHMHEDNQSDAGDEDDK